MASRAALPSDPELLLDLMHDLPVDSDSDDEFDGNLEPEDGPVVFRSAAELDDDAYTLRSQSLQDLTELEEASEERLILQTESPLLRLSPSLCPMQGQHASGSPLAGGSPTQPSTAANSSSTLTSQVHNIVMTKYTNYSDSDIVLVQPPAFTATSGVVVPHMENKEPIDFFHVFFDGRVLDLIHRETTRYTQQYLEREREHLDAHPQARAHEWRRAPLTLKEVEIFLALIIAMGICGFPTMR